MNLMKIITKKYFPSLSKAEQYTSNIESFLKYSIYIASLIIFLLIILSSFMNIFNREENSYFNDDNSRERIEQSLERNHRRINRLRDHLHDITLHVKQFEQNLENTLKVRLNPREMPNAFSYFRSNIPISFFIHIHMFDLISNAQNYKQHVKIGLSWSIYRNNTQVPISSFNIKYLTGRIMFDGSKSFSYLLKHNNFFESKNINLSQYRDETLSFTLSDVPSVVTAVNNNNNTFHANNDDIELIDNDDNGTTNDNPNLISKPSLKHFFYEACYIRFDLNNFLFIKVS